ncbi:MAG: hypothetical protein NT048_05655 [Flavobacterium sp.]|nr:hypothetical protein [Flavobacterium sp.]
MKKLIKILIILFFSFNSFGQIIKQQFEFESNKIEYSFISSKYSSNKFFIVITKNETELKNLIKIVNKCFKTEKKIRNIYFFAIPNNLTNNKESIVLDFIYNILSKKKLIDKEMNVIADENYFKLYEETRFNNKGKYKNSFLNKIHKTTILNLNDNICSFLN